MSPLPKSFDLVAIRLRRMIIEKRRPEAKRLALDALAKGKASAQVQKIAADLFGGKRGRPVSGAKHRWVEMGEINDDIRAAVHRISLYRKRRQSARLGHQGGHSKTCCRLP